MKTQTPPTTTDAAEASRSSPSLGRPSTRPLFGDQPGKEKSRNQPVHRIRHGAISASIWRQETEKGPVFNVTFQRSYKDGEKWKTSNSFGRGNPTASGRTTMLMCPGNHLTRLSGLCALEQLDASFNDLVSLSLAGSPGLEELQLSKNHLSALDVRGLSRLRILDCY